MSNTEFMAIDDANYQLRLRLGWFEQAKVNDAAFSMFVDGRSIAASDNLAEVGEVEIRINRAGQALARLRARLVGVNSRDIPKLPPAHVARLLERIEQLEAEEKEELGSLASGNPIEKRLRESSVIASSED